MTESHSVLDRQLPPSTQEISTLDHNLGKTGTGRRHSVNALISMPIPETVLQVDQQLPPITEIHTSDHDSEKSGTSDSEKASISIPFTEAETLDIEHVPVHDDPRKWSSFRKVSFLTHKSPSWVLLPLFFHSLSYIACYPGVDLFCIIDLWTWHQYTEPWVYIVHITYYCLTIIPLYPAAVEEMEIELPATPSQFSLSIALFILFQGVTPLFWSAISEVKGRKASQKL